MQTLTSALGAKKLGLSSTKLDQKPDTTPYRDDNLTSIVYKKVCLVQYYEKMTTPRLFKVAKGMSCGACTSILPCTKRSLHPPQIAHGDDCGALGAGTFGALPLPFTNCRRQ